jgi:hypothetical protein
MRIKSSLTILLLVGAATDHQVVQALQMQQANDMAISIQALDAVKVQDAS